MDSSVMLEQCGSSKTRPASSAGARPAREPRGVVIASFPLKGRDTEGNAQVRGVSPKRSPSDPR